MRIISSESRKKYISALKRNFLFDGVSDFQAEKFLNDSRVEWMSFEKGETIYDYDNYKNSLGIILKGSVLVKKGRDKKALFNTLKTGEAFGGAVLFRDGPFIAGITAQSRSDIVFISADMMRELMSLSMDINMNYIRYITDSLVFLNEQLDIFSGCGAEERTLRFLEKKSRKTDNGLYVFDDMSLTSLAEYLSVGRATLYRILSDFESKGIIKKDGRKIYLLKGEIL